MNAPESKLHICSSSIPLASSLGVRPGITAVIGAGGKTTLLRLLAKELTTPCDGMSGPSNVILCTSTHILPFPEYPSVETPPGTASEDCDCSVSGRIHKALEVSPIVCVGTPETSLKAGAVKYTAPSVPFEQLAEIADYVLVEADGSRHHSFKAHAAHEPVIPEGSGLVIYVAGASGFMKPVRDAVHRPELFCAQMNRLLSPESRITPDSLLTPELAAAHIGREDLADVCCLFSGYDKGMYESIPKTADLISRFRDALSLPLVVI